MTTKDAQGFFSFEEILAFLHERSGEAMYETDSEEDQIKALVDAIVADPHNIMQFETEPGIMERVFIGVLAQASEDMKTFFRIARVSRNPALLKRLAKWAIKMNQADVLALLLLRSFPDWDDQNLPANILVKLIPELKPDTAIHILYASNPIKGSGLQSLLDVDQIWQSVIRGYLKNHDLKRAYLALLWAGRGFRIDEHDPAYYELSLLKREFINHIKDWHANDDLCWRVFGRTSKEAFAGFIPIVWKAHVEAGCVFPNIWAGIEGFPVKILVRSGDSTTCHTRMRKLPYSGMVARFIKGEVLTEFFTHMPFLHRAKVANATLTLAGAMLQQMIIYYSPQEVGMVRVPKGLSLSARKSHATLTAFDVLRGLEG